MSPTRLPYASCIRGNVVRKAGKICLRLPPGSRRCHLRVQLPMKEDFQPEAAVILANRLDHILKQMH